MPTAAEHRSLRIALISSSYAPHIGGVEEHVAQVARALARRGHQLEVWTVDRGQRPSEPPTDAFPVRYLTTPLPARRLANATRFLFTAPVAWVRWRRALRQFRPDVLVVQCFGPNGVYALGLHRRSGIPLVVVSHGETRGDDDGAFAQSALLRRSLRESLTRASAIAAPSHYVLVDLSERFGGGEGTVIPNGVAELSNVPNVAREDDLVIAVGRLGAMKGFDLLITAFASIDRASTRLEIVGDGPERAALQTQIDAAGLSDRVRLIGARDAAGVADRIAAATLVVVPSRSESFGIVALEAWRGGAPLIMTTRGGASEFVRDGEDGLLVDPVDTRALGEAITRLLDDSHLRAQLASRGADRVDAFRWPRVAVLYEMMLGAVVRQHRRR
jgi:glycosyltransferase involved in cell wall biosynthesis